MRQDAFDVFSDSAYYIKVGNGLPPQASENIAGKNDRNFTLAWSSAKPNRCRVRLSLACALSCENRVTRTLYFLLLASACISLSIFLLTFFWFPLLERKGLIPTLFFSLLHCKWFEQAFGAISAALTQEKGPGPRCTSLYQKRCMPRQPWRFGTLNVHPFWKFRCPTCGTHDKSSGFLTIGGIVVVITMIDVVEGPSQENHVWAKPATVIVARVMHKHWCIACVCVFLPCTSTEDIDCLPIQTPIRSRCTWMVRTIWSHARDIAEDINFPRPKRKEVWRTTEINPV